jgi:hypothetical protein
MLHDKKTFLQQGSALYAAAIELTNNQVIRRHLAARIIVNAMAFEDVVDDHRDGQLRRMRDVLLAHKQEPRFSEGFRAFEEIKRTVIDPQLQFMKTETGAPDPAWAINELQPGPARVKLNLLFPVVFKKYEDDFLTGSRLINNPFGFTGSSIHEVSENDLAAVFYRYNSAMASFQLAQYTFNNSRDHGDLIWVTRHAKLDMVLHAQNMADSVFKARHNSHSIDGLLEVMTNLRVGNASALSDFSTDSAYNANYDQVGAVRNKLIGHMDKTIPLSQLMDDLDKLPAETIHDLVNRVDRAVHTAAGTHPAIKMRYVSANVRLDIPNLNIEPLLHIALVLELRLGASARCLKESVQVELVKLAGARNEACEHKPHQGLRRGRILDLEAFEQFLGSGVVLLRHLIRERDSDMDHGYLLG